MTLYVVVTHYYWKNLVDKPLHDDMEVEAFDYDVAANLRHLELSKRANDEREDYRIRSSRIRAVEVK